MIISKATGYGIRALAYMTSRPANERCSLREIALHEQIPPVYLQKILGMLRRQRLVRSTKGIHGGYELNRPPQSISLWEIFEALDPQPDFEICPLDHRICARQCPCVIHNEWQQLRLGIMRLLQQATIRDVAEHLVRHDQSTVSFLPVQAGERGESERETGSRPEGVEESE